MDPATVLATDSLLKGGLSMGPGAGAGPAGPSAAYGGSNGAGGMFDSSGWNVNFGAGGITSSAAKTDGLTPYLPYLIVGAVALVAWKTLKR